MANLVRSKADHTSEQAMTIGAVIREGTVDARFHEYAGRQFALKIQHLALEPAGLSFRGV